MTPEGPNDRDLSLFVVKTIAGVLVIYYAVKMGRVIRHLIEFSLPF